MNAVDTEIQKLVRSKRFHTISDSFNEKEKVVIRQKALASLTGVTLSAISSPTFDIAQVATHSCENLIGKTEIPLGLAGPLLIKGSYAKGEYYVPLATTEGALLASINRGCVATAQSGGIQTFVEKSSMTRAPVFRTKGIKESARFISWVENHTKDMAKTVKEISEYLTLLSVTPFMIGKNVYLRFEFDTADAMGMNMVTIACDQIIRNVITPKTGVLCVALSGNMCVDKKASYLNFTRGRGHRTRAEVIIPRHVVASTLKTDPETIVEVNYRKNLLGTIAAGSFSSNAHYANIIAALFIATGQDVAHVVEGSLGITTAEMDGKNLYFSIFLPDLPLGTVGGGTTLSTQQEALELLQVAGGGKPTGTNAKKLAEIAAATVLSGELSLLSALASSDLAKAHKRLARGET